MVKTKKRVGVAKHYPNLTDELTMRYATVTFSGSRIRYQKKNNGKPGGTPLVESYPKHAVAIIHTRLKGGDEVYLLQLIQKIERENLAKKISRIKSS